MLCQHTDGSPHDMPPVASLIRAHVALPCLSSCSFDDQGVGLLQVEGLLDNEASQQTTNLQKW
jgi:hypothetical protein